MAVSVMLGPVFTAEMHTQSITIAVTLEYYFSNNSYLVRCLSEHSIVHVLLLVCFGLDATDRHHLAVVLRIGVSAREVEALTVLPDVAGDALGLARGLVELLPHHAEHLPQILPSACKRRTIPQNQSDEAATS